MSVGELVELAKVDPKRLERSQVGWLAMDNNKLPYVTSTPNLNVKSKQPLSSSSSYPPPTILATTLDSTSLNNDISEMSNNPPGNTSHKRARSEIFTLPKDINIEGDIDTMDGLSLFDDTVKEDLFSVYLNMNKLNPSSGAHDTVIENFAIDIGNTTINERLKVGHQHSQPINGSTSIMKPDIPVSTSENGFVIVSRKAMSAGELVERAKVDPKHAERCQVGLLAMDNNKLPYVTSTPNLNVKSKQLLSSSSSYPPPTILATTPDSTGLKNDISEMPDNPLGNTSHKRARSEILTLPADINIDSDIDPMDGLSLFDDTVNGDLFSAYLNMDKLNPSSGAHATVVENFAIDIGSTNISERLEVGHRHRQSINGSTSTIKPDIPVSASENGSMIASRKVMSGAELVELAKVDPKRVERIWANRQSVARSKEKKTRYIFELENKVQKLETEVTSLSTQLTILQRDTQRMATKNDELRLQLETKRQQLQLQNGPKDFINVILRRRE
ncbi:Basic-leucine zipper domain [Sesbania bispinosa]|nr:Basic-leucine zipper domain [Sesbania bispinosa]